ncbi:hypothetical protein [Streptomyces purpureus]|uniref:Uncharacterized protein n=1 Tax=Streptomyces purpureus TaxID=1951 RepID=A0A918LL41_9ACTN|nr:hypothetical protein [Streptomyces purpureus]GGT14560.1 hypothetical protein GCM10014713_04120 [Streptomyces purpureus]
MTNERILAVCRSNWEYRGIDDASVREMLEELSAHLEDAEAAGRTPQDVVGDDVKAFAAAWARARAPLSRRIARMAAMALFVVGAVLLVRHLVTWSLTLSVGADDLAFWAVIATFTVVWEIRRGGLGLGRSWLVALAVGLPVAILTRVLGGDEILFSLPLWVAPLLLLPGLPYAVADGRARKSAPAEVN